MNLVQSAVKLRTLPHNVAPEWKLSDLKEIAQIRNCSLLKRADGLRAN